MIDVDFLLDRERDHSSCPRCGSREPARLGVGIDGTYGCSDCTAYPRCTFEGCIRWTGVLGDLAHTELDHIVRGDRP